MEIGSQKRRGARTRSKWKPLLTVILILVAIRLVLPFAMQAYFNARLDQINGYTGRVDSVSVRLLRGSYTLQEVEIVRRDGEIPPPFFTAERIRYSMRWSELIRGSLLGSARLDQPVVHFAIQPDGGGQSGAGVDWLQELSGLSPLTLDAVEIHGGRIHVSDFGQDEPVHAFVADLTAEVGNLQNRRRLTDDLFASLRARGRPMGVGRMTMTMAFSTIAESPHFDLNVSLSDLPLESLDAFLRLYGNYQVEAGMFDLYSEVLAEAGGYEGRSSAFFSGLVVQLWREPPPPIEDGGEGLEAEEPVAIWPLWELWDDIREPVTALRGPPESLVLRAPFTGAFEDPAIALDAAVLHVLLELMVHGLVAGLEAEVEEEDE